jgi:hypothetical protein
MASSTNSGVSNSDEIRQLEASISEAEKTEAGDSPKSISLFERYETIFTNDFRPAMAHGWTKYIQYYTTKHRLDCRGLIAKSGPNHGFLLNIASAMVMASRIGYSEICNSLTKWIIEGCRRDNLLEELNGTMLSDSCCSSMWTCVFCDIAHSNNLDLIMGLIDIMPSVANAGFGSALLNAIEGSANATLEALLEFSKSEKGKENRAKIKEERNELIEVVGRSNARIYALLSHCLQEIGMPIDRKEIDSTLIAAIGARKKDLVQCLLNGIILPSPKTNDAMEEAFYKRDVETLRYSIQKYEQNDMLRDMTKKLLELYQARFIRDMFDDQSMI